ncbi:MAG: DUF2147 domain-containing protein [Zoogloeaceae bacterium]|jgi:uncharacterized protein (DUF2147 family)|nr:DUF2147 domain-containing protein [Zoogloeaceae bacterium]
MNDQLSKRAVRQTLAVVFLPAFTLTAQAQMTPVGTWHSIDDETRQPKAQIVINENNGTLTGRIEQLLRPGADPKKLCDRCADERKNQPVIGLEIIRGVRKADGEEIWEGGKILDPENGKEYRASLTPVDGGGKLEVRGYFGPFWRTQTWVRIK